ncbi:ChaC-like protein-domain-containing protein [Dunaliella salina]|uniref:glutathione-specific gamma-glutamylcyclotransferase n=1 Tax=Dunaliella salina TaxID=3046 RepID=A0ABQ7FX76_DUNSA|nr:ChaC-like protein-domain-containing protein [Dunaliella salina]|eukprot:KAF5826960.1 ChaC-like protein-domain-containing protein [Dunaliella salina]
MAAPSNAIFSKSTNSIWIFGYGSLVHTPGFEVRRRVKGYVRDWKRVWHQGSTDHRGTLEFPGRTVTLQYDPGAITWGVAYELAGNQEQQAKTLKYLEWREKQYDIRERLSVYGSPDELKVLHRSTYLPSPSSGLPPNPEATSMPDNHRSFLEGLEACTQPLPVQNGDTQVQSRAFGVEVQNPGAEDARTTVIRRRQSKEGASTGAGVEGVALTSAEQESISFNANEAGHVLLLEDVLCYIASPNKSKNVNYLGPATADELALQIARAVGPSGPNWEYVAKLANAMRSMEIHDPELFALEKRVAQTMLHLKQEQQVDCREQQLSEEARKQWQALKEHEEQFLNFHTQQLGGSNKEN